MNKPSPQMTFDDLYQLRAQICQALAAGVDRIWAVQKTDTLEVTAFVLKLLIRSGAPIIVTGVMRTARVPGRTAQRTS